MQESNFKVPCKKPRSSGHLGTGCPCGLSTLQTAKLCHVLGLDTSEFVVRVAKARCDTDLLPKATLQITSCGNNNPTKTTVLMVIFHLQLFI